MQEVPSPRRKRGNAITVTERVRRAKTGRFPRDVIYDISICRRVEQECAVPPLAP